MMFFPLFLALFAAIPSALLALLISRWRRGSTLIHIVGMSGPLVAASAGLGMALTCFKNGPISVSSGIIFIDALSAELLAVIALVSLLTLAYSIPYMGRELAHGKITHAKLGWYYFWLDLLLTAMYATVVFNSLGITWVLIEATTLASVPLVGYYGTPQSLEAAWKYLMIASVGISFALLGILLTYIASSGVLGAQSFSLDFTFLRQHAAQLNPDLLKLAFLFILVGYGTKTGLAPMHTWLPDAHSQAPAPISALMSGALLNCALYGFLRFNVVTSQTILGTGFSSHLLQGFGLFTVGIVIPFLFHQNDFKRLLAYSSVEHMGIITLALGIGGELGYTAVALHLFTHALTKSSLFCIAGEVTERYGTREIRKIRGVLQATPLLGVLLFLGALAIMGVPPSTIFTSELVILSAAFANHQYLAAYGLPILLTLVFVSLLPHIAQMAFGRRQGVRTFTSTSAGLHNSHEEQETSTMHIAASTPPLLHVRAEPAVIILLAIPTFVIVLGGIWIPDPIQTWLHAIGGVLK